MKQFLSTVHPLNRRRVIIAWFTTILNAIIWALVTLVSGTLLARSISDGRTDIGYGLMFGLALVSLLGSFKEGWIRTVVHCIWIGVMLVGLAIFLIAGIARNLDWIELGAYLLAPGVVCTITFELIQTPVVFREDTT